MIFLTFLAIPSIVYISTNKKIEDSYRFGALAIIFILLVITVVLGLLG